MFSWCSRGLALRFLIFNLPARSIDFHFASQKSNMLALLATIALAAVYAAVLLGGSGIPIIDISSLVDGSASADAKATTVAAIGQACRDVGFFYITDTGVPLSLTDSIEASARTFFQLPAVEKRAIDMARGGRAWRGYFGVGDELTSGRADQKEGIYFGTEGQAGDLRPLHGPNVWPAGAAGAALKADVTAYMAHMKRLGAVLMDAIATHLYSLHASKNTAQEAALRESFKEPTELFRIFGYPSPEPTSTPAAAKALDFGVGEHTDYGYLTILYQDDTGGLEVRSAASADWLGRLRQWLQPWTAAPPVRGSFVINLGDALEHHSGGYLRATPHRVLFARDVQHVGRQRVSFPYFFDPNMASELATVTLQEVRTCVNVSMCSYASVGVMVCE